MNPRTLLQAFPLLLATGVVPKANADLVYDWNQTARAHLVANAGSHYSRGMTMVHVAQFDAINAVLGGYTPYALGVSAPNASPDAAAVQAAYTVLTNISRAGIATLNTARTRSLAAIPDGPAKDDGLLLGARAAAEIIRVRATDNPDLSINTPTSNAVGKWRITPPNSAPGIGANSRYTVPWTLRSMSQFRPGPPPALGSAQYAADFEEARQLGARNSAVRTPDQAEAAEFHGATDQTYLLPALAQRPLPLLESARFAALFYMAWFDAGNAFLEAQYAHSFWRPYSAIRLAETDGNDATSADPTWNPFFDTPNHPEYPSGTCTFTTAMIEVVIAICGDDFGFTGTYEGATKPRVFARPSAVVTDAVVARIAAGAHFRTSCLTGVELGRQIAANALANFLRPLPHLGAAKPPGPGEFRIRLTTTHPLPLVIETSADLVGWMPWRTNVLGTFVEADSDGAGDRRFYRIQFPTP